MASKKKNNGMIIVVLLIILMIIFITLAAFLTSKISKSRDEITLDEYPASTLEHDKTTEQHYEVADYLEKNMDCPSLPYSLWVPDNIQVIKDNYFVDSYDGISLVIMQSENSLSDIITQRAATTGQIYLDNPDAVWNEKIGDSGYANGFKAQYVTGYISLDGRFSQNMRYAVAYQIETDEGGTIALIAFCEQTTLLNKSKNILDDIVLSISNIENENILSTEGTEEKTEEIAEQTQEENAMQNIMETETEETAETGDAKEGYWKHTEDGFDMFVKEYQLNVDETIENMYLVFQWNQTYCTEMTVTAPDGKVYSPDENISFMDSRNVFIIPDGTLGVYTIHYENTSQLTGVMYEALTETAYNAIYNGIDENGDPWLTMPGD